MNDPSDKIFDEVFYCSLFKFIFQFLLDFHYHMIRLLTNNLLMKFFEADGIFQLTVDYFSFACKVTFFDFAYYFHFS